MEKPSVNNQRLQSLLKTVSKNLGVQPDELKVALESGKLEKVVTNMGDKEKQKLQSIMGNKDKMEKLMESPQAKALYEKLTGKKPK